MTNLTKEQLKPLIDDIIRVSDLSVLTLRSVRRQLEKELKLSENVLDEEPAKSLIKDLVNDGTQAKLGASEQPTGQGTNPSEPSESPKKGTGKRKRANQRVVSDSDNEDEEQGFHLATKPCNENDAENIPEKPTKLVKSKQTPQTKSKSKPVAEASDIEVSEKDAAQISRLKEFVSLCGIRKMWGKEFSGLNGKARIARLKDILADAGITDRPTKEKCKEVKQRLAWEAELRELDTSNILAESGAGKRRR